jgi:tetratricopeptide (TPR) repeat protein
MRALLTLAAALAGLAFTGPVLAQDEGEAARCAGYAARLDKPLGDPAGVRAYRDWALFLDGFNPIPFSPAAVTDAVIRRCGDEAERPKTLNFLRYFLAATGDLDAAEAIARDQQARSPSKASLETLARLRLRRGDEAGALALVRSAARPDLSDERILAELYDGLGRELASDAEPHAALQLMRKGEAHWRALADADPGGRTQAGLFRAISQQGAPLERLGENHAAAETYGRAAALLEARLAHPLDRFDARSLSAGLTILYASQVRAHAAAGERVAAVEVSTKAFALASGEVFAPPGSGLDGQIATGRWAGDPTAGSTADAFRQIGASLAKVGAPDEALPFLRFVADFRAQAAQAEGRAYEGRELILVAEAQRLAGRPGDALRTMDGALPLLRAPAPDTMPEAGRLFLADGLLEKGLTLDDLGRGAEACAAFRDARATYSDKPTHYPVTDPLLTRLDEAVARPACAKPL